MTRANNNNFTFDELEEIDRIKRFMIENGFTNITADVLNSIATLIYKSTLEPNLVMNNEYAELAATGSNGENYRAKLGYYISSNFIAFKTKIFKKYGYDIGEYFSGVKTFIEKTAILYSLYVRN